jgi:hypothetical protein
MCEVTTGDGPFQEQGGMVVMEAESHDALTPDNTTNDSWGEITVVYASGGACMQVGPDSIGDIHTEQTDVEANSARMGYEVDFATSGTWHIWVRGASKCCQGYSSNSCHAGIDGTAEALYLDFPSNGAYAWVADTVTVSSPGVHTINLFMREDGFIADKILLTTDSGYTPSGLGPNESPRQ